MNGTPFVLNLIAPSDGPNNLYFVACTDNDEDTAEARVAVTVDNSGPVVTINQPALGANGEQRVCVGRVVDVCGQVADPESRVVQLVVNDTVIENLPADFNGLRDFSQAGTCLGSPYAKMKESSPSKQPMEPAKKR